MLNLNAMFAGVEDITGSVKPTRHDISAADNRITMLKYMELEQDFAIAENEAVRGERMQLQLEQLLSMYDHVKKFGVDRAFLALYNDDGRLERATGIRFPSFESMDCVGVPTSTHSQMFIAAMEDENDGLLSKLWKWLMLLWDSLKKIATVVWEKIKSFFGSADKSDSVMIQQIQAVKDNDKISCTIEVVKQWAFRAILAGITTWTFKTLSGKVGSFLDETFTAKGDRETLMKHAGIDTELVRLSKGSDFKEWADKLGKCIKDADGAKDKINKVFEKIQSENLEDVAKNNPELGRALEGMRSMQKGLNLNYDLEKNNIDGRSQFKQEGFFKSIFTKAGRAIKFHKNEADAAAREITQLRVTLHKGVLDLYNKLKAAQNAQNAAPGGSGNNPPKTP